MDPANEQMETSGEDLIFVEHEERVVSYPDSLIPQSTVTVRMIREWLKPTDYNGEGSEYKKHLFSHLTGTGTWFRASNEYNQWHDDEHTGLLWAQGIPGSGKSVLAASLIDHLSRENVPVLYFFFRKVIDANHKPGTALQDWLDQLLDCSHSLQFKLAEYLPEDTSRSHRGISNKLPSSLSSLLPRRATRKSPGPRTLESFSSSDLWQHVRDSLSRFQRAYIVVDALDEMDTGDATDSFLQHLVSLSLWRPAQIKVLVTSRPIAGLEKFFPLNQTLRMRLEENMIDLDISAYVKNRLAISQISREHHILIQNTVPGNANGLFLYAKLAMDAFTKEGVEVEKVLDGLPTNLHVMYSQHLEEHSRLPGMTQSIQLIILSWATHSIRPLRLLEVADMLNTTHPVDGRDLQATKDLVRSACGPLLEILPDETLCVVHHTLTEFLVGTSRTTTYDYPILKSGPTHTQLAIICLKYLQSGCLADAKRLRSSCPPMLQWLNHERSVLPPFTKYAARNWHIHVQRASEHNDINSLIDKLIAHEDFKEWLNIAAIARPTRTIHGSFPDVFQHEREDITPLYLAVYLGLKDYATSLLSKAKHKPPLNTLLCLAAKQGNHHIAQLLLDNGADSSYYQSEGLTPLHLAAMNNHGAVVTVLLQAGCDVSPESKKTPSDIDHRRAKTKYTPLWHAVKNGHNSVVQELLLHVKEGSKLKDALSMVVELEKADMVKMILKNSLVDVQGQFGESPLHIACTKRNYEIIDMLLDAGADASALNTGQGRHHVCTHQGYSVLHSFAGIEYCWKHLGQRDILDSGSMERCFSRLVAGGADVNQQGPRNRTPLHEARDELLARLLIQAGANVEAEDESQQTPIHTCGDKAVKTLLEIGGANLEKTDHLGMTPLLSSLHQCDTPHPSLERAGALLDLGVDFRAVDKDGNGVFHALSQFHQASERIVELIGRLCKAGADINMKNRNGQTALHKCLLYKNNGSYPMFEALLQNGADLDARDRKGMSPLFFWMVKELSGVERDIENLLPKLFEGGTRIDQTDEQGRTLLQAAVIGRQTPTTLRWIIEKGVNPEVVDKEGNTLWHIAAPLLAESSHYVNPMLIEELVRMGVDSKQPNHHGQTPLHILSAILPHELRRHCYSTLINSTEFKHPIQSTTFDYILESQKDIDHVDQDGVTPLHLSCTFSEYQARKLLAKGAGSSLPTKEGLTPLHLACRSRQPNIVGMLLECIKEKTPELYQKTLNARDSMGRSALYYACLCGSFESAQLLVNAGAHVSHERYECSPFSACAQYEDEMLNWPVSTDLLPPYKRPDAGGVLIDDNHRTQTLDRHSPNRIEELYQLLLRHENDAGCFLDKAIYQAAELKSDHIVRCMLRVRQMFFGERKINVTTNVSQCLARLAEKDMENQNEDQFKDDKQVHERKEETAEDRILRIGNYRHPASTLFPDDKFVVIGGYISADPFFGSSKSNGFFKTLFHHLAGNGFASELSRFATRQDVQKVEDPEWCKTQEAKRNKELEFKLGGMISPILHTALRRSVPNMDVVRILLEDLGVDVNAQGRELPYRFVRSVDKLQKESALHIVMRSHYWWSVAEALPYLLEHGADTELRDSWEMTPLSAALELSGSVNFQKRSVELLVKYGANVNAVDKHNKSCLTKALHSTDMIQFLLDHGAVVTRDVLIQAMDLKRVDLLAQLLSHGANPNIKGVLKPDRKIGLLETWPTIDGAMKIIRDELYPLHYAIDNGTLHRWDRALSDRFVETLLSHGADPVATYGDTSILHELLRGRKYVDPFLRSPYPLLNLEARDHTGSTLLLVAGHRDTAESRKDNAEGRSIVELLVNLGADVRAQDNDGNTILHHLNKRSLSGKDTKDLELVMSLAPDLINIPNAQGRTPLLLAADSTEILELNILLDNGADVLAVDSEGNSVIHFLAGHVWRLNVDGTTGEPSHAIRRCIDMGADINAVNHNGETAIFSYFRTYGTQINVLDPNVRIMKHPKDYEKPVFEAFSKMGVDWKVISKKGQNLLHIVAWCAHCRNAGERFSMLVDLGLDVRLEDASQRTPVDIAAEVKNQQVLALFRTEKHLKD